MRHRGRKNSFDLMPIAADFAPSRGKAVEIVSVPDPTTAESAPAHLSLEMRDWWASVTAEHDLDAHRLHLLRLAAEAYDRAQQAREQVARDGPTFTDKNGCLRAHPMIAVEHAARASFAKLVAQLNLDPPRTDGRLGPRMGGGIGWKPWEQGS